MRTDVFHALVRNPAQLNEQTLPELQQLVERFPWFAPARILLALNMERLGHMDRKDALTKAAATVPNRTVLAALFQVGQDDSGQVESGLENQDVPASLIEPMLEPSIEIRADVDIIDVPEPLIFVPQVYDIERELGPYTPIEIEVPVVGSSPVPATLEVPENLTFAEWLAYTSTASANKPLRKKPATPQQQVALMEEFLAKLPEIEQSGRKEFFTPEKAAKRSVDETVTPVSETLATIYLSQGSVDQAVRAYQQLALQHPEKSSYFAALIEKAKDSRKTH